MSAGVETGAGTEVTPAVIRRVGPNGNMASDNAFGVALVTLWHRVSEAGGAVGFVPPVARTEVAPAGAAVVEEIRRGRAQAIAVTVGRALVGFGVLTPGVGITAHTGRISELMVDPEFRGRALGGRILGELLDLAGALGLARVDISMREGQGADRGPLNMYGRFGFAEWGRRQDWIKVGVDDYRDEVFLVADVPPPVTDVPPPMTA